MKISQLGLVLGPLLFLAITYLVQPAGLSSEGVSLLAITAWIAVWWISEAIPIAATAMLPLVLFPLTGILGIKETSIAYSDPMVLLYMGGFMIAVTIERWNLHKRIALNIIAFMGTDMRRIIFGFMLATAFLSMWISNTATSLMMLPIAVAVISQMATQLPDKYYAENTVGRSLMLGIAYSASIGGMATIIGTPTNIILVGVIKKTYGIEIGFSDWMMIGLPLSLLLLGVCWYFLVYVAFDLRPAAKVTGGKEEIVQQLKTLGKITVEERRVLYIFLGVSGSWISRSFLFKELVPVLDDTIIALLGVLLLFVIPAKKGSGPRLLDWKTAESIPWGILILFGGGLALAIGFQQTGLAQWIGNQFVLLQNVSFWLFLLLIILSVNFLTEITSNVATASMLLPILAAVALAMNVHPFGLMVAATMAASCAFMLPVATPPNAVVFGSGFLTIPAMMRAGFWMNLISVLLIFIVILTLLPRLWGIDLHAFPDSMR